MINRPSTAADNGRLPDGRFGVGNKAGKGNPFARRVARLRAALLREVSPDDLREIVRALVKNAKAGDVASAREVLSRCLGEPQALDLLARVEEIEQRLGVNREN